MLLSSGQTCRQEGLVGYGREWLWPSRSMGGESSLSLALNLNSNLLWT